ncbi:MAG: SDR family NAD(P)-dependent oxidoreductase, partial [Candidatus Puniceispirillaceae bacterium]
MKRLAGKSALITGAARGIGLHFAEAYVNEGARVAIADINIERGLEAAKRLGDQAIAIEMDVTSQASIDAGVAATVAAFGGIDILINNAAVFTAAVADWRMADAHGQKIKKQSSGAPPVLQFAENPDILARV